MGMNLEGIQNFEEPRRGTGILLGTMLTTLGQYGTRIRIKEELEAVATSQPRTVNSLETGKKPERNWQKDRWKQLGRNFWKNIGKYFQGTGVRILENVERTGDRLMERTGRSI